MHIRLHDLVGILLVTGIISLVGTEPLPAANPPPGSKTASVRLLDLTAQVPATWVAQQPSSSMRLAQFRVPGKTGSEDAELVVFHFGQGQGGSAEANIARWQSEFSSPDGKPVKASIHRLNVSGMPATTVELTGSYARTLGMTAAGAPVPDQTLLAAIVESPKGNLFIQLHGPKATVAANREAFLAMIRGMK